MRTVVGAPGDVKTVSTAPGGQTFPPQMKRELSSCVGEIQSSATVSLQTPLSQVTH
ncbi:MAG: hypothetical protein INH41_09390 [Myxococcaceae bacterium]|nr:hypothetical protein [Myxococcaceae bacterium]